MAMASDQKRLELKKPEFSVRAQNFLNLLNVPEFQDEFLRDPGGVISRELALSNVKRSQLSTANRLTHRLLTDKNFNKWAADFQHRVEREFPMLQRVESMADIVQLVKARENRTRLMDEFSRSAIDHLSPGSFEELFKDGVPSAGLIRAEPDIAFVPLTFIAILVVIVVVAGYGRPIEKLSRVTLQLTINQLTPQQQRRLAKSTPGR